VQMLLKTNTVWRITHILAQSDGMRPSCRPRFSLGSLHTTRAGSEDM